jgi:nucleotide-binding universal stress UspA family protein
MPEFSRVLCAIDLTAASRRALDCGLWWARLVGADVSVLHVHQLAPLPDPAILASETSPGAVPPPPPLEPVLTAAEHDVRLAEVEEFVFRDRTDGLQVEVLLDEDVNVADTIVARSDALAADLIVIGAGTGGAIEHPVLGPTTLAVLREAPCSVLIVPTPAGDVANPCLGGLKRMLCALSLSPGSTQVLECAAALADAGTAHLAVVHVVELTTVASVAYDFDAHREARIQPACEALVDLGATVVGRDRPLEEIVAQGTACDEVLKLASEEDVDLVVVGRGSGRAARGAGRPTAQIVAREARCPVLFVHTEPAAAELRPEPSVSEEVPLLGQA